MMDGVLQGLELFSADYIDDMVVFSTTWKDHVEHLRQVLLKLKGANLTAKIKKCKFGMKECVDI